MKSSAAPCALAAALLGWTLLGVAAPPELPRPTRAALRLPQCDVEPEAVRGLSAALALELRTQHIALEAASWPLPDDDSVSIVVAMPCDAASSTVQLRVSYKAQQRFRQMSLVDLPEGARARALALSTAELVALVIDPREDESVPASVSLEESSATPEAPTSAEPAPEKAPETAPPPKPATPARPKPAPPKRRPASKPTPSRTATESATRVSVAAEARGFDGGSALWGARAELARRRFVLGAALLSGGTAVPEGDVSALLLHAVAGYRVLEWQSARYGSLAAGPRLGLGLLRASGTPNENVSGGSIVETYADAAVFGSAELRVHRDVRLGATVEAGYAHGVIGLSNGEPVAHYGGAMAGVFVGVGFGL